MKVPIYILAGGKSSRFGSDKARAMIDGRPLLRHVVSLLAPVAQNITIVADRADKYSDLGLPTLADLRPSLGPLGGLQTALTHLSEAHRWLLLCSCDVVVFKPAWLELLLAHRDQEHQAVAFFGEFWQPMPALYARSCLTTVTAGLDANQLSLQTLLRRLKTRAIPLPEDWPGRWQANTPQDLRQAGESF